MKIYLLALTASLLMLSAHSQSIGINGDHSAPNPAAILDVKASNRGLLVPRMSQPARLGIPNTKGLLVYDTSNAAFFFNDGAVWKPLFPTLGYWTLAGNSFAGGGFIGTTDSSALLLRVGNIGSGMIDSKTGNTSWGFNTDSVYIVDSIHNNNNTAIGSFSLTENVSGSFNTMLGRFTQPESKVAGHNTGMGFVTLGHNSTGQYNVGVGYQAIRNSFFNSGNTGIGGFSLVDMNTGNYNTDLGEGALLELGNGSFNTALGNGTMSVLQNGSNNTALGWNPMSFGQSTGSNDNTALGNVALSGNTTGNGNTASGSSTMQRNTTGSGNTALGPLVLPFNSTGNFNTGLGIHALENNTTGSYNTATAQGLSTNSTGSFNTAIGFGADVALDSLYNATVIGNGAVVNASNKVRIGGSNITVIEGQVPYSTPSDGRYKFDVEEDVKGLDFILRLRPVTYLFDDNRLQQQLGSYASYHKKELPANTVRRSGFIAQEVERAASEVGYDFSGINRPVGERSYYTLSYESFVVPLVKGMQQQQRLIDELDTEIGSLGKQAAEKRQRMQRLAALQQEINNLSQTLTK